MDSRFSRTEIQLGAAAMERLGRARVAVFGLGGVGGYTVEALARSGIGALDLIDDDRVSVTNINRQIIATDRTVGQYKADAAADRVAAIAPDCAVRVHKCFYTPQTADQFDFTAYDYIVDAIDTVTGKLELAVRAKAAGTPLISAMGAGNKLDPTAFEVADIAATSVCPLARVMRKELKKRGIEHLKVVYSKEPPLPAPAPEEAEDSPADRPGENARRSLPGSNAFVPAVMGLILAGEVVKDLIGYTPDKF